MRPAWLEHALVCIIMTAVFTVPLGVFALEQPLLAIPLMGLISLLILFKSVDALIDDRLDETEEDVATPSRDERQTPDPTD